MARTPWYNLFFCTITILFVGLFDAGILGVGLLNIRLLNAQPNPYQDSSRYSPPKRLEHNDSNISPITRPTRKQAISHGEIHIELSGSEQDHSPVTRISSKFYIPKSQNSFEKNIANQAPAAANSKARLNKYPSPSRGRNSTRKDANPLQPTLIQQPTKLNQKQNSSTNNNAVSTQTSVAKANYLTDKKATNPPTESSPNDKPPLELQTPVVKEIAPRKLTDQSKSNSTRVSGLSSLTGVLTSLAIVLGLFFIVMWLTRRGGRAMSMQLPNEVFEVLGRASSVSKQQMQLLRLGNKLILVSVSAAGMESIAEITDTQEVDRLCGLCLQSKADSSSTTFKQILQQFGSQSKVSGFVENEVTESDSQKEVTHA